MSSQSLHRKEAIMLVKASRKLKLLAISEGGSVHLISLHFNVFIRLTLLEQLSTS